MMTREEAIKHLRNDWFMSLGGQLCVDEDKKDAFLEAVGMGIKALHPVSREQVEKVWRGEWNQDEHVRVVCNRCGSIAAIGTENALHNAKKYDRFCFYCGAPMTDEAVEMVMERLEALHEDNSYS